MKMTLSQKLDTTSLFICSSRFADYNSKSAVYFYSNPKYNNCLACPWADHFYF